MQTTSLSPLPRRARSRWRSLALLLAFILPASAASGRQERERRLPFDDPGLNSVVVASVGPRRITAREFLLNYAFGPAFPKREKDSRKRYLNFMIYEKLLALDGVARGVDRTEDARISLAELEGDLATEELYRDDIASRVRVTDAALRAGKEQERRNYVVRWVYDKSRDGIRSAEELLRTGLPFDSLFMRRLGDSVKAADRSMSVTRFRIGLRNPSFAAVLDTIPPRTVSGRIAGPDGWYLIRVDNIETAPLLTQSDELKAAEDVRRALVSHISDSLSDRYVDAIMRDRLPVIVRRSLDVLHARLAEEVAPPEVSSGWNLAERLRRRWGRVDTARLDGPLVEFKGGAFTVREFLNWYRAREVHLQLPVSSPEQLYASLEAYVWRMTRDKLLTARALARGLQRREGVRRQLAWWKDKIVYNLVKAELADSIRTSDDILKSYYREHTGRFRDAGGAVLAFEKAKDDVLREYYSQELVKRSVRRILALKAKYPVAIDDRALDSLVVDTENDPKAIDVYTVKAGGIFPRPAFPVIDQGWQTWN